MILEIILFIVTFYLCSLLFNNEKDLPPEPWQFPFIGRIPLTTVDQCIKYQKKFGDVFMTRLGRTKFVYVTDFKMAKEVLSKTELASRPNMEMLHFFKEEKDEGIAKGIISSNGSHWLHNRRFLLRNLRDLGMGKSKIEDIILREIEILVDDFKSLTNEPSKLPFSINVCVLNVIWQLVASHRYDFSDLTVRHFMKSISDVQEAGFLLIFKEIFPFLKYVVPKRLLNYVLRDHVVTIATDDFKNMVQPFIDEHLSKLDPENPSDLIDEYLAGMKTKSETTSHFSNDDLLRIMFDLFVAGNDTTSNNVCWVLFYLSDFPHIQKKAQEEIDRHVPRDKLPGLEHRERLSYLEATINEVQRLSTLTPFGVMRSAAEDVRINGYRIPKGSFVSSIAGFSHQDPRYWKDPEVFNPGRFLDPDGKFVQQPEGFQPFGIGKRQCLGEAFARMELYLIIGALLQNFFFSPPPGKLVDLKPSDIAMSHLPNKEQALQIRLRE